LRIRFLAQSQQICAIASRGSIVGALRARLLAWSDMMKCVAL
jgi:hypothetical protein